MYCSRIHNQYRQGKERALLPLAIIPEEEVPGAGQEILILTAPVRGLPYWIEKIKQIKLSDLTDEHFDEIGMPREAYLAEWDKCNTDYLAKDDPDIMLLWLCQGW